MAENLFRHAPDDGSDGNGAPPPGEANPTGESDPSTLAPVTWDEFLETAPEPVRNLYTAQTAGLQSALATEREERKALAKKLKDATSKMEEGSEARTQLEQVSLQLEAAQKRADFFEEAARPESGCANPKLAFIAAQADDLIDDKGRVDWEALRESYPELFRQINKPPAGNAGTGTANPPPVAASIDSLIRRKAGVVNR
jgi:hypothetical protein